MCGKSDCIFLSAQEDYHKLLTKYAEAENTIDQLRLGAKVLTGWSNLSFVGGAKSGDLAWGRDQSLGERSLAPTS